MADQVRFGIVGCGMIGPFHADSLKELSDIAQLVAVADLDPAKAQQLGEQHGVDWYTSYAQLLERSDIDAISVCTPSGLHAEHGIMAARAGKHVLSEKPLDVRTERVDALIAACQENKVMLGGIFQNRFSRAALKAKRIIDEGYLGEIIFASASCLWYRTQAYYDSADWRGTWALDGGVLSNQGIHFIDRLIWLAGMQPEVLSAYCPTLQRTMEAEDLGVAVLRFPNGAGGAIHGSTLANPGLSAEVLFCGTRGSFRIESNEFTMLQTEDPLPPELAWEKTDIDGGAVADPAAIGIGGHVANIREFVTAVQEGREPSVSGTEGRKAVQLLNDIYAAAGVGPWARAGA